MKTVDNKCIRCGKDRVFEKTWEEKTTTGQGSAVLTYNLYVCPDKECQKKVEKSLAEKQKISEDREKAHQKRLKERNIARAK